MSSPHTQKGMTLIEAMVWIAVFLAAMVALTTSLVSFYKANGFAIKDANAIASAQHAMDIAVRAIRTASYANNGAYPVISIASDQIAFYANVTKGSPYTQKVRFFTSGNSLKEGIIEPVGDPPAYTGTETVTSLSDYVQNLTLATSTFYYYDKNGTRITDYSQFQNVRFVTVNLIVDTSTTSLPTQLTLTSSAALRNLIVH